MRGQEFTERKYPHLPDTKFPDISTVNPYKYENNVPYEDYTPSVKIKMMNVSWCGDYDNTVYFETKEERDAWFFAQKGLVKEMPTMFRLYPSGTLKVECPIDEAMNYNYVMIDYGKTLYQSELSDNHIMFYFINGVEQKAPNTTELTLVIDYWTTYINDMDIEYVSLLRGHAPMAATNADVYLSNPIENCEFLLSPDVNYGSFQRVVNTEPVIFNDDNVTVGFLTNASMQKSWFNNGNPKIPTAAFEYGQAFSAVDIFVIDDLSLWNTFRDNVTNQHPEFWETVKGIFLIPKKLITESNYLTGNYFMFCGVKCHHLETDSDRKLETITFTKDKFGYPKEFADIAKLYTFPYAAVEVDDFKGNQMLIKIEDTSGSIELHTIMCDMFPFLNIEAYMTGIGSDKKYTISFKNSYENTFTIGGRDYNFSTKWFIPVFAVQLEVEDNWELNGKIASDMFLTNNSRTARMNRDNSYDSARVAAYNALTSKNEAWQTANTYQIPYNKDMFKIAQKQQAHDYLKSVIGNVIVYDQQAAANNIAITQHAAMSVSNGLSGLAGSTVTGGAVSSTATAPITIAGAAANYSIEMIANMHYLSKDKERVFYLSYLDSIDALRQLDMKISPTDTNPWSYGLDPVNPIQAYSDVFTLYLGMLGNISFDADEPLGGLSIQGQKLQKACGLTEDVSNLQEEAAQLIANNNRALMDGGYVSYNNIDWDSTGGTSLNGNIPRTYDALIANYNNRYDAEYRQKLLDNPPMFGQMTGTPDIISKPFGVRYNFVTQSKNAIRQAGEQFLRYGYFLNMEWKIDSFNLMSMFTYWKCDRVYCNDKGVYEGAQDMIKSILVAGTTVWRHPEDIGVKSIYQNVIPS